MNEPIMYSKKEIDQLSETVEDGVAKISRHLINARKHEHASEVLSLGYKLTAMLRRLSNSPGEYDLRD